MNLSTSASIAFRSFRRSRRKGTYNSRPLLGAVLGVALSLVPLITVLNISEGMIQGIVTRFLETDSYHLQVFSYTDKTQEEFLEEKEAVSALDDVVLCTLERKGAGLAYSEQGKTGIALRAIEKDYWEKDASFREYIEVLEGEFDLSGTRSAVLGSAIADKLGVGPGDSIKILTGKVFPNGRYIPKVTPFTVTGVVSSGYQEIDRLWIFIPYEQGVRILSDEGSQTILGIKTRDPYANLYELIGRIGAASPGPNWRAYTWEALNRGYLNSYETTRSMLIIIMAMLVAVAVINVSSSLVMLIIENRQPIGIMKCLGASPAGIRRIYRLTGLFVGVGGALSGCLAGVVISRFINEIIGGLNGLISLFLGLFGSSEEFSLLNSSFYLQEIPITLQWDWILFTGLCAVLLSWISSAVPAARAGKIRPLEIIRKF